MYQPPAFQSQDTVAIAELMRTHPLATLVHVGPDGVPVANVLPLLWQPDDTGEGGVLIGHVARANPVWQQAAGQQVLAMFQGPQAYVSPGWYPSKAETGKAVPTWNYTLVQAQGTLSTTEDPVLLRQLVSTLTNRFEADQVQPWSVDEAPPDYLAAMLRAIVGLSIRVARLTGKFKLSQNQPAANQAGVRQAYEARADTQALAAWMARTAPKA